MAAAKSNKSQPATPEAATPKAPATPEPLTPKVRIVIADDHAVLRESLAALLESQADFEVVGKAANGTQALELVQQTKPNILVLDLFMPGSDGFEVLRTLDRRG